METDGPLSPTDDAPPNARSDYAQNREILRQVAERMRNETDIDIDELIPLIDRASAAYKVCRERVEAVEKLIRERLPQPDDEDE